MSNSLNSLFVNIFLFLALFNTFCPVRIGEAGAFLYRGADLKISSMWGQVGASCETVYSISKAGMDALTKSLAKELGPSNIRVNSIAPGVIDTEMNSKLDEQIKQEIKNETPIKKIGKTTDIYRCVKWLIEDEFTTGQVISVNGGYVIT